MKILVCLYQRFLNCSNITYIITSIISSSFKDLNFLILSKIDAISNIGKIIIFVDNIEKNIALGIYLQTFLPDNLKNKGDNIIKSFLLILEIKTKTN